MTNETLAEISRQTRDRLAVKANNRIGQLADLLAGTPEAAHIIGSLRSIVEMLRDTNSDDVQLGFAAWPTCSTSTRSSSPRWTTMRVRRS
ncbi:hypothetical protein GS924_06730 [Rhodococcus hoagii]|nr:hypothetical protein [Prescottella equi]